MTNREPMRSFINHEIEKYRAKRGPRAAQAPRVEPETVDGVPITRGPSCTHDPRYSVGPGEVIHGEFSRLGVGRYVDGDAE